MQHHHLVARNIGLQQTKSCASAHEARAAAATAVAARYRVVGWKHNLGVGVLPPGVVLGRSIPGVVGRVYGDEAGGGYEAGLGKRVGVGVVPERVGGV